MIRGFRTETSQFSSHRRSPSTDKSVQGKDYPSYLSRYLDAEAYASCNGGCVRPKESLVPALVPPIHPYLGMWLVPSLPYSYAPSCQRAELDQRQFASSPSHSYAANHGLGNQSIFRNDESMVRSNALGRASSSSSSQAIAGVSCPGVTRPTMGPPPWKCALVQGCPTH